MTLVFPAPGWKLVPVSVNLTRSVRTPLAGLIDVMIGFISGITANLLTRVFSPPSVTTRIFQGPIVASSGIASVPSIRVAVTFVSVGTRISVWFRNCTVVLPGPGWKSVPVSVKLIVLAGNPVGSDTVFTAGSGRMGAGADDDRLIVRYCAIVLLIFG